MLKNTLPSLKTDYKSYHPCPDAAVLVALFGDPNSPNLVLTQRAAHLNSHAGEVSLPGGKWESVDLGPADTALRESEEEIALPREQVTLLGELPDHLSKTGLRVKPVVGWVEHLPELVPCPDELESIFVVPMAFLLADDRVRTDVFRGLEGELWSPAWRFNGYEIWGLTARILVDLLNDGFGANLSRASSAPETRRG